MLNTFITRSRGSVGYREAWFRCFLHQLDMGGVDLRAYEPSGTSSGVDRLGRTVR